jgi:hypothetical protein
MAEKSATVSTALTKLPNELETSKKRMKYLMILKPNLFISTFIKTYHTSLKFPIPNKNSGSGGTLFAL